jgi:mannosyltransferase
LYLGLLLRLLFRKTVKVVFTRHAGAKASRWTQFWAGRADRVIALTEEARTNLALPAADIVHHGVDLEAFKPPEHRRAKWSALHLGGTHGIGVVGRIRPSKGQGDFVAAIAPLLEHHPSWRAVLIGQAKGRLEAWAQNLKTQTNGALALVAEQPDSRPWYQGLSVLVHPSHTEGFSLVLVEAMASGCCVIASRLTHVPDVVTHEKTGLLYEPGDIAGLRALLERVMQNPDEAARFGAAARAEVVERFGIEHEASTLRRIYAQLTPIRRP